MTSVLDQEGESAWDLLTTRQHLVSVLQIHGFACAQFLNYARGSNRALCSHALLHVCGFAFLRDGLKAAEC